MKKFKYLIIISAFIFLVGAGLALAQTSSGTILPPPQTGNTPGASTDITPLPPVPSDEIGQNPNGGNDRYPLPPQKEGGGAQVQNGNNTQGDQNLDQNTQNKIQGLKAQMDIIKQKIQSLRDAAMQKLQGLKDKITNEKNKAKAKAKQDIVSGREEALVRFDDTIQRIEDQRTKVEKQVSKMEGQGTVISDEIKGLSVTAESKLNDARAKVVEINTLLAKSINQLSKEDKTKLQTLTKDTQGLIKDAQKALNDEVFGLRKLINPNAQPPVTPNPETAPGTSDVPTPGTSTSSTTTQ